MIDSLIHCACGERKLSRERICRACRDSRMLIATGRLRSIRERRSSLLATSHANVERKRLDANLKPTRTTATAAEEKALAWHGEHDDTMPMFEEDSR